MNTNTIGVIGIGKLGLSFALLCERMGYTVIGCDNRADYVADLNRKEYATSEPHISLYLQEQRNFTAITDIEQVLLYTDMIFCFVATPSLPDGSYDHGATDSIVNQLQELHVQGIDMTGKILVIGCTTMPGYTQSITERLSSTGISVSYNPEFIAQGSIIEGLRNADMVLMGVSEDSTFHALQGIYRTIMGKEPIISRMSTTAAEITKISINCFLTMKIAYANIIGEIVINSGLEPEISTVLKAIGSDSRIGQKYLNYGFGYGGVCLPRDQKALGVYAQQIDLPYDLQRTIDNVNDYHHEYLLNYYIGKNPDKNAPFQFTQLTYKKGVDILTESQQYRLCKDLLAAGYTVAIDESDTVIGQLELSQYDEQVIYGIIDNAYKIDI